MRWMLVVLALGALQLPMAWSDSMGLHSGLEWTHTHSHHGHHHGHDHGPDHDAEEHDEADLNYSVFVQTVLVDLPVVRALFDLPAAPVRHVDAAEVRLEPPVDAHLTTVQLL